MSENYKDQAWLEKLQKAAADNLRRCISTHQHALNTHNSEHYTASLANLAGEYARYETLSSLVNQHLTYSKLDNPPDSYSLGLRETRQAVETLSDQLSTLALPS